MLQFIFSIMAKYMNVSFCNNHNISLSDFRSETLENVPSFYKEGYKWIGREANPLGVIVGGHIVLTWAADTALSIEEGKEVSSSTKKWVEEYTILLTEDVLLRIKSQYEDKENEISPMDCNWAFLAEALRSGVVSPVFTVDQWNRITIIDPLLGMTTAPFNGGWTLIDPDKYETLQDIVNDDVIPVFCKDELLDAIKENPENTEMRKAFDECLYYVQETIDGYRQNYSFSGTYEECQKYYDSVCESGHYAIVRADRYEVDYL